MKKFSEYLEEHDTIILEQFECVTDLSEMAVDKQQFTGLLKHAKNLESKIKSVFKIPLKLRGNLNALTGRIELFSNLKPKPNTLMAYLYNTANLVVSFKNDLVGDNVHGTIFLETLDKLDKPKKVQIGAVSYSPETNQFKVKKI